MNRIIQFLVNKSNKFIGLKYKDILEIHKVNILMLK